MKAYTALAYMLSVVFYGKVIHSNSYAMAWYGQILRNKLGNRKAAKVTSLFKSLNLLNQSV